MAIFHTPSAVDKNVPKLTFSNILARNRDWADRFRQNPNNADRIRRSALGQSPQVLWIGCCDSRVPETTITDLSLGDLFVHRNIANIVRPVNSAGFPDSSLWSSIEYSVEHFPIHTIVICGHSDCGGAKAALTDIENDDSVSEDLKRYLYPLVQLRKQHQDEFKPVLDGSVESGATNLPDKVIEAENAYHLAFLNVQNGIGILKDDPLIQAKGIKIKGAMYSVATLQLEVVKESAHGCHL